MKFAVVTQMYDAMHNTGFDRQAKRLLPYKQAAAYAAEVARDQLRTGSVDFGVVDNTKYKLLSVHGNRIVYSNEDFITPELKYIATAIQNALDES